MDKTGMTVIGTCGICGGRVLQHAALALVGPPPPPKCEACGATALQGPVLPMRQEYGPVKGWSIGDTGARAMFCGRPS